MIRQLVILVQIAFRNLFASFLNVIVGFIIFFGTLLMLVGSSLLDSVEEAMSKSVIGSVAGHIQIYSEKSKDEFAIYGQMGEDPDLAPVHDFAKVRASLQELPNVQTVVPMGIAGAMITGGNTMDLVLADLRRAVKAKEQNPTPEATARIESLKSHVQQMIKVLSGDLDKADKLIEKNDETREMEASLARVRDPAFWTGFDAAPYDALEFLENRIAPTLADGDLLFLRYVGTDLDAFQQSFDRMKIVDGTPVPKGQRGYLFAKFVYEEQFKLKQARRLDKIKEGLAEGGKTIATNPDLQRLVKENKSQPREILLQLDGEKTKLAIERLNAGLKMNEKELAPLLAALFDTDDSNFQQKYDLFYGQLAPLLKLYRVGIGDTLTISAFTRSGYAKSVNLKVYGTFDFNGLEKSALAGGLSLMDLMSFRDLYGYLTADEAAELKEIQKAAGSREVARENAEAELFGGGGDNIVASATPGLIDDDEQLSGTTKLIREEDLIRRVYTREELEGGVVLNAAVILKDPTKLEESIKAIEEKSKAEGLNLRAISWQKAAGLLGQLVEMIKLALMSVVFIIFIVAIVVINNAMMMATLQRVREFGTVRAIGAQKSFVLGLVMIETLVLGLFFGGAGALAGAGVVAWIAKVGIPASNDAMYFFFAGPRLRPFFSETNLIFAFVTVLIVSAISTFYPAILATRVSPLRAMQAEE